MTEGLAVAEMGERVAVLETRVGSIADEVLSLRSTRHEHANRLQFHDGRLAAIEEGQQHMILTTMPDFTEALEALEERVNGVIQRTNEAKSDQNWTLKILGAIYAIANSVAIGFVLYVITKHAN